MILMSFCSKFIMVDYMPANNYLNIEKFDKTKLLQK